MAGKMSLGTQVVTPSIDVGEPKIYNVDGYDWLGEVNAEGELVPSTKELNVVFNGVKEIDNDILQNKFSGNVVLKSVSFPDLERLVEGCAFYNTFYASTLESINFPKLKSIVLDDQELEDCFSRTLIENAYFPELELIGYYSFAFSFDFCDYLKTFSCPKLKLVKNGGMYQAFVGCSSLETINFESLEHIESYGLYGTFFGTKVKSVSFDSLKVLEVAAFGECLIDTQIETIRFPLLSVVGSEAFESSFAGCENLTDIYFDSLDSNSFGDTTDQFWDMLGRCSNVTVHFPVGLDAIIGDWEDVLAGFSGTNTTILYDL